MPMESVKKLETTKCCPDGAESQALIICDLELELAGASKTWEQTLSLGLHTRSDCEGIASVPAQSSSKETREVLVLGVCAARFPSSA